MIGGGRNSSNNTLPHEFAQFEEFYPRIMQELKRVSPSDSHNIGKMYLECKVMINKLYLDLHHELGSESPLENPAELNRKAREANDEQLRKLEEGQATRKTPTVAENCMFAVFDLAGRPLENTKRFAGVELLLRLHYPLVESASFSSEKGELTFARKRQDGVVLYVRSELNNRENQSNIRIEQDQSNKGAIKHLAKIGDDCIAFAGKTHLFIVNDFTKDNYIRSVKEPYSKDGSRKIALSLPQKWQINEIDFGVPFAAGKGFICVPALERGVGGPPKVKFSFYPSKGDPAKFPKEVTTTLKLSKPQTNKPSPEPQATPADNLIKYFDIHTIGSKQGGARQHQVVVLLTTYRLAVIRVDFTNDELTTGNVQEVDSLEPGSTAQFENLFVNEEKNSYYLLYSEPSPSEPEERVFQIRLHMLSVGDKEVMAMPPTDVKLNLSMPVPNRTQEQPKLFSIYPFGVLSYKREVVFIFCNLTNKVYAFSKRPGLAKDATFEKQGEFNLFDLSTEPAKKILKYAQGDPNADISTQKYGVISRVYSSVGIGKKDQLVCLMLQTPQWTNKDGNQHFLTVFTLGSEI